jgi:hypothetical protein
VSRLEIKASKKRREIIDMERRRIVRSVPYPRVRIVISATVRNNAKVLRERSELAAPRAKVAEAPMDQDKRDPAPLLKVSQFYAI